MKSFMKLLDGKIEPISLVLFVFALVKFWVDVQVRDVGLRVDKLKEVRKDSQLCFLKDEFTSHSAHPRDSARRRPHRRRFAGLHVPCNRENIAYIVWDTLSGDESRAGRADRLSAMGTDDASVLIDIVS